MTMRHRFAIVAAIAATLSGTVASQAQINKLPNLITVTGEAEVGIVPDLAILSGGVTTIGKTAREASEANAKMIGPVMAALKAAGIAEQDVQTSRLALHPVRDNNRNDLRVASFQASNQVIIKVRDIAKTVDVIDRLVAAGANDISGIQFVVSLPSKPLDQGREAAIADARRKAEIYARAANMRLGAPVSITEEGSAAPGPVLMRAAKSAGAPVSPGEEIQRISVSVSYELLR
jgi:uncharacterized protein YggE